MSGLEESLLELFDYVKLSEVECDNCKEKTDSLKGIRIQKLPPLLTFCLKRFELDYETMQRKKINDKFSYPLELNMANFLDP